MSAAYAPALERGLRHDDPALAIGWPLPLTVVCAKAHTRPACRPQTALDQSTQPEEATS